MKGSFVSNFVNFARVINFVGQYLRYDGIRAYCMRKYAVSRLHSRGSDRSKVGNLNHLSHCVISKYVPHRVIYQCECISVIIL